jgi:hypothetical protein
LQAQLLTSCSVGDIFGCPGWQSFHQRCQRGKRQTICSPVCCLRRHGLPMEHLLRMWRQCRRRDCRDHKWNFAGMGTSSLHYILTDRKRLLTTAPELRPRGCRRGSRSSLCYRPIRRKLASNHSRQTLVRTSDCSLGEDPNTSTTEATLAEPQTTIGRSQSSLRDPCHREPQRRSYISRTRCFSPANHVHPRLRAQLFVHLRQPRLCFRAPQLQQIQRS